MIARKNKCVRTRRFSVQQDEVSREENFDLLKQYNLTYAMQQELLSQIDVMDFSKAEPDRNNPKQLLFFFGKDYSLYHIERGEEIVTCYIKFAFEQRSKYDWMVVVSFHRANGPIAYAYK